MLIKIIDTYDCKEGNILAEKISNGFGATIVVQNTVLNNYIINRLVELGINQVKIYDDHSETDNLNNLSYKKIEQSYNERILAIKSIASELISGKSLDVEKVNCISNVTYSEILDSTKMFKILNRQKKLDEYTYTHSMNVAFYSMLIGKWLDFDDESIKTVIKAGLLHDIGKAKIPMELLNKKERLTDKEFELLKRHTIYGYELVKSTKSFSDEVSRAVLLHHERHDGSGYPFGIDSRQLDTYANIVAIADVYDAMTSDRVYKKRDTPFEVFNMFQTIGLNCFEVNIIKTFLTNLSAYYVGSKILLNTGEIGEIVYIPPHNITKPIIGLGSDYIDMAKEKDKNIIYII